MSREVLLFHHALGLTPGVLSIADDLRAAGHTVHTPDLFGGRTFDSVIEAVTHAHDIGLDEITALGVAAAADLPHDVVYAGFSLGVLPAQKLAQLRPGAGGALLFHSCLPLETFGPWPAGVPVQVHAMDEDPFFVDDGDLAAAEALVAAVPGAELHLYPGKGHLFADPSRGDHDPDAAALLLRRVLAFLN
ncbi:dienelactone hydrolase family protein [Actinokineospora pegani]|uniref:dienelactone hydrolase family protein n=1 Tax=Actinokineospora pegani TaxID=2654637 RepID=UPI0012EA787E|nr:dienelactone hydrolase family protein [Actinokineospora pegani]